jgi:hypothetical protein
VSAPYALVRLAETLPGWEVHLQVAAASTPLLVPQVQVSVTDARTTRARYTVRGSWQDHLALAVESLVGELLRGGVGLTKKEEKALKILSGRPA